MKNTTKWVTYAGIPALIILILIYDIFAIAIGGTEASISSLLIVAAYEMPFMTFMIGFFNGVLVGHLYWRMKSNKDTVRIDTQE